ncbi:LuxR family transcriptional regulator [Pseudonocardia sp. EC080610-09]|uniref:response regulator n=1 Tax=unclassified Pseudonocardia TaxID=2619320 RepID=UPI0006CB2256|nr:MULTISPECIES: response regulator transcription factor [unclassified Pseudonocardia]ALE73525.1 LuxR family transcriptional regulator [Pseudonocardia sp. EC080625-04]ALL76949.1 LuxR family transcriptional regulator [Pseudonocardia sp. EC080610-09]ALL83980.1 LuxR family transcriptional regulator [Pseudonocardia sp. EC080619-01]
MTAEHHGAHITVMIVDDQEMVRGSFAAFLDAQPDIRVVAQAADGAEAVRGVAEARPDVVLMDVRMPVMDGLEATRRILGPDGPSPHVPKVVMVTTFDIDDYVHEALRAGASGFLLKDAAPDELTRAVRVVAAGDALLAPSVTRLLLERFAEPRDPARTRAVLALDELTRREREVLVLIGRGLSNREIARELFIGEQTVKTHVGRLLQKVPARDRVQLVITAYDAGLVEPGS